MDGPLPDQFVACSVDTLSGHTNHSISSARSSDVRTVVTAVQPCGAERQPGGAEWNYLSSQTLHLYLEKSLLVRT